MLVLQCSFGGILSHSKTGEVPRVHPVLFRVVPVYIRQFCCVNTNIREASHLCTEIVDRKTSDELKVVAVVDVDLT